MVGRLVPFLLGCSACLAAAPAAVAAGGANSMRAAITGPEAIARVPADMLARLRGDVVERVLDGRVPAAEFLAGLGLVRTQAPNAAQQKQWILHWLYTYSCLAGGIDDDPIDEASLDGRCSYGPMSDSSSAPYPNFWYGSWPDLSTYYYHAPWNDAACSYDTTDVSRYWVTWVRSPAARAAFAWLGASDYFKLWVNGTLVLSRTSGGSKTFTEDEYHGAVSLLSGWNLIVFKQSFPTLGPADSPNYDDKNKFFSLRFVTDAGGTPVGDLVGAFDPFCDETTTPAPQTLYTTTIVPTIAHLPGYGGSRWRSDIALFNGYHLAWQYRFHYYKEGNNTGVPDAMKTVELPPYGTLNVADALHSPDLFGVAGDEKGYFFINGIYYWDLYYSSDNGWLAVKMYNLSPSGTFGMAVPPLYYYDNWYDHMFFPVKNGSYRTNYGIVPALNKDASALVELTLFGPGIASPVKKQFLINGYGQLNNVFSQLGIGGTSTEGAFLWVRIVNGSNARWLPYVTLNDGNPPSGPTGTSDPTFMRPGTFYGTPPDLNP